MQADPDPSEGDMAMVYNTTYQNWQRSTVGNRIHFPDTVTLPSPITQEYFYGSIDSYAVDSSNYDSSASVSLNGMKEDETFVVDISIYATGMSETSIQYTTEDNQHFVKTEGGISDVELPLDVAYSEDMGGEYDEKFGYFVQAASANFDGVYVYKLGVRTNKLHPADLSTANVVISSGNVSSAEFTSYVNAQYDVNVLKKIMENGGVSYGSFFIDTNDNLKFIDKGNTNYIVNSSGQFIGIGFIYSSSSDVKNANIYDVDLENLTLINPTVYSSNTWTWTTTSVSSYNKMCWYQISNMKSCVMSTSNDTMKYSFYIITQGGSTRKSIKTIDLRVYEDAYSPLPTQFNATSEYVYEKAFLGKSGADTGTLASITSNNLCDVDSEVYAKIQDFYDTLTPITLTNYSNLWSDFTSKHHTCRTLPTKSDGTPYLNTDGLNRASSLFYEFSYLRTIPNIKTTQMNYFDNMFYNCPNLTHVPNFDMSNATDTQMMFYRCKNLTSIPNFNTSKVTNMYGMFSGCESITEIPNLDTSNVTCMAYMFSRCINLSNIPNLNTSKVNVFSHMFENCMQLNAETMPNIDTSKGDSFGYIFQNCWNLIDGPNINTSNGVNMTSVFFDCKNIVNIPNLNMTKANTISYCFYNCQKLENMPAWNLPNVKDMSNCFSKCYNLSNQSLDNIMNMCVSATQINSSNKTLKYLNLSQDQTNVCKNLPNYSAFTSAGWSTGY